MADQEMMLNVPPGTEPTSDRSLSSEPEKQRKTPRLDRARGIVKMTVGSDEVIVTMRPDKMIVRRPGKRHRDEKPLSEVVDFVIGQGDLFRHTATEVDEDLAYALADLIAALETDSPAMSFIKASAIKLLEEKAPGKLEEARHA